MDQGPYALLAREHRLIERGLDVLSRICGETPRTRTLDQAAAASVIHFLRDFADRTHHLKEERILFPAIEEKGFFPGCGLLGEHREGRERIRAMTEAAERSARGDPEAVRIFVRKARSYIDLLRAHILKEDECLASTVARVFSSDEGERLTREFERIERREIGAQAFERFESVVRGLERKYGGGRDGPGQG
jgi:hemerythrin-like domain-containing protein